MQEPVAVDDVEGSEARGVEILQVAREDAVCTPLRERRRVVAGVAADDEDPLAGQRGVEMLVEIRPPELLARRLRCAQTVLGELLDGLAQRLELVIHGFAHVTQNTWP